MCSLIPSRAVRRLETEAESRVQSGGKSRPTATQETSKPVSASTSSSFSGRSALPTTSTWENPNSAIRRAASSKLPGKEVTIAEMNMGIPQDSGVRSQESGIRTQRPGITGHLNQFFRVGQLRVDAGPAQGGQMA